MKPYKSYVECAPLEVSGPQSPRSSSHQQRTLSSKRTPSFDNLNWNSRFSREVDQGERCGLALGPQLSDELRGPISQAGTNPLA